MVIFSLSLLTILSIQVFRLYFVLKRVQKAANSLLKREKELHYLDFLTSSALNDRTSIQEGFPKYLNYLRETLNWTYHSIFRLDELQQVLIIRFTGNLPEWYMKQLSTKVLVRVGDASVGRAVSTKQPVTINTASNDPRFKSVSYYTTKPGYKSLSCYPLVGRIKTHGGFCTYSEHENIFTLHDTQFFLTCSNIMAAILENRLLNDYLKGKN